MKILILDHPQHTHGTWMLYEGLVRILGRDSIILFPPKPPLWGDGSSKKIELMSIQWYKDVYNDIFSGKGLPNGIPPLSQGEMLTAYESTAGYGFFTTHYNHVVTESPDKTSQEFFDEDIIISLLKEKKIDIIILGNSNRVPTIALARLRDRVTDLPPVVYFDAGERDEFNAHWWHVFKPNLVFKNIVTPELLSKKGSPHVPCDIYPMPLSHTTILSDKSKKFNIDYKNLKNRKINLVSSFGNTWETRRIVQQKVEQVCSSISINNNDPFFAILNGYSINDLFDAKISISMRGSGRDTERYWDMPAAGATMICDGTMGCIHPFPFVNNETALFYKDLNELEKSIRYLVSNDDERIRIGINGHNHIKKYHSVEARALFFLGIVKNTIGLNYSLEQNDKINDIIKKLEWSSYLPDWQGEVYGFKE
jgi:hypothetical protein